MNAQLSATTWHCRAQQALQATAIETKLTAVADLHDGVRSGALVLDGRFGYADGARGTLAGTMVRNTKLPPP